MSTETMTNCRRRARGAIVTSWRPARTVREGNSAADFGDYNQEDGEDTFSGLNEDDNAVDHFDQEENSQKCDTVENPPSC